MKLRYFYVAFTRELIIRNMFAEEGSRRANSNGHRQKEENQASDSIVTFLPSVFSSLVINSLNKNFALHNSIKVYIFVCCAV